MSTDPDHVDTYEDPGMMVPGTDQLRRNLDTPTLRGIVAGHPSGSIRAQARDLLAERGLAQGWDR